MEQDTYQLLDAGHGRKVESFSGVAVIRPCPQAVAPPADPGLFASARAIFEPTRGWHALSPLPEPWILEREGLRFELALTPSGQVGYFPEHARVREHVARQLARSQRSVGASAPVRVLDLFGYTGGTALTAARTGAEVTYVDASKSARLWAARNAAQTGLPEKAIRWIVEDAMTWVNRERKRGSRVDAVILDPPSFGRGTGDRTWKLERHLPELLGGINEILGPERRFVALTAHTEGWSAVRLLKAAREAFGRSGASFEAQDLTLEATSGARVAMGSFVFVTFGESSPPSNPRGDARVR